MGNSESKAAQSATLSAGSAAARKREGSQSSDARKREGWQSSDAQRREGRRRESSSIPALSHATKSPAPPAASLIHSTSKTTKSTPSSTSSHSRARSVTTASTPQLQPHESAGRQKSATASMGQEQSKKVVRPPSRSQTLPTPPAEHSRPSPLAQPVDVPLTATGRKPPDEDPFSPSAPPDEDPFSPSAPPDGYGLPPSNYSRPPRLPLPIEEELHIPGSPILSPSDLSAPILSPADLSAPIDQDDIGGALPRRTSVLSSTTVDDDDLGETDAFEGYARDPADKTVIPVVPTPVEWKGHGAQVYVTGTFANWDRKFRLNRNKDRPGFSASLPLQPGTHHVKFLVDGDMYISNELPTTVDYTNILVNYIEVVAPLPSEADAVQPPAPAQPMPIPGAAATLGQTTATNEPAARPLDIPSKLGKPPEIEAPLPSTLEETVSPRSHANVPTSEPGSRPVPSQPPHSLPLRQPPKPTKPKQPRPKYTATIPDFLVDLDSYSDPPGERSVRAHKVLQHLPQPPSLPGFLGKSILNGTTPMKDDNSVLIMPNHTVINHLATSSIKNGVLATSGTTRYKRKFLTTVMYKPTTDAG